MFPKKIGPSCLCTWRSRVRCGSTPTRSKSMKILSPPSLLTSLVTRPAPRKHLPRKVRKPFGLMNSLASYRQVQTSASTLSHLWNDSDGTAISHQQHRSDHVLFDPFFHLFIYPITDDHRLANPKQEKRALSQNLGLIYMIALNQLVSRVRSKSEIHQILMDLT